MKKKVLAIYFTQTGQLKDIVEKFTQPFRDEPEVELEIVRVWPDEEYSFPWSSDRFFGAMPDSVLLNPEPLKPFELKHKEYDLVIFAYQPWFLSPSIPATSILKHPQFRDVIAGTPVITLIGARNMWLNAQEKVKEMLEGSGAELVGNVALVDRHNNLASGVSIVHWLMGGKKDRYLGVFPKPGVADRDIENSKIFGELILHHLKDGQLARLQQALVQEGAVEVRQNIMFIESKAARLFNIWATFISGRKKKSAWLKVFKYYLFFALFIVSPLVLTLNIILIRPFTGSLRARKKNYYLGLNKA